MFPASAIFLVLPVLGDHTATDLAAGAEVRDSFGVAPQQDNDVEPTNRLIFRFLSGLRVQNARTSLVIRYTPRLTFQNPNPLDQFYPLWFQTLSANYTSLITRRLTGSLSATGDYGQLSYIDQALLFDPGTTTQDAKALRIVRVRGQGELSYKTGRANTVSLSASGYYQDGVPDPRLAEGSEQPESFQISSTLSDSYQLTAVDSLQFVLTGARVWREIQGEFVELFEQDQVVSNSASVTGGWTRKTSKVASFSVSAGLGAFNNSLEDDTLTLFPVVTLTRDSQFGLGSEVWTNSLTLGVRSFLDVLRGEFRPMASINWNLSTIINGEWRVASQFFASTLLTRSAAPVPTYDTNVRWTVPVSYPISNQLRFNTGLVAGVRLGYWKTLFENDDPLKPQPFFNVFLGLHYTFGTDRELGSWL